MRPTLTVTLTAVIAAALLSTTALAAPAREDAALVVVEGGPEALVAVQQALEAAGARVPHRVPPDLLVGAVPPSVEARFVPPPGARVRILREGRGLGPGGGAENLPRSAAAARIFAIGAAARAPRDRHLPPPSGDLVSPVPSDEEGPPRRKALGDPDCERPAATSAYLVGSVAVAILMPESVDPAEDTENWSNPDPRPAHAGDDRRDLVVAEIMEGMDALATQLPLASLSFVYDIHRDIPIAHEPILHSVGARSIWIDDVMAELAYGGWSTTASVGTYLRELRDRPGFDTDWAVAAFVADDLVDGDNGFPPTGFPFAYALLGGPYMVMTYDNDGYSIDGMDSVAKHELGHCFRALDEYSSAGNACSSVSGYLSVANENNDSTPPCLTDVACIMRGGTPSAMCDVSLAQLGIRDTDGDTIPDVRDAPPDSHFDEAGPLLVELDALTLTGTMSSRSRAEESPDSPTTFTINRVASGEWRIDGGSWQPLAADDGAYGGRCERFSLDLASLAEGWHDVEVRATNNVALIEPSPARVRVYVNTDCSDDAAEPDDSTAQAKPRPAGVQPAQWHCAFDDDWSRFHLQAGSALDVRLTSAPALPGLELELVGPSGEVISSATGVPGYIALAHVATSSGAYRLRVLDEIEEEGAYVLEINSDCIDDPGEDNDTFATGKLLRPGLYSNLTLCAGDRDFWLVSAAAGETVGATIRFENALGDLDFTWHSIGGAPLASSLGVANSEGFGDTPVSEGVMGFSVYGKTPTAANVYELELRATGCQDDVQENDDTPATARVAPSNGEMRQRLCPGDEDWFRFDVVGSRLIRLQATFNAATSNLDLELHDSTGARLIAASRGRTAFEDITSERLRAGTYLLRVFDGGVGETDYLLTFESVDPITLFVARDPADALLTWTEARQECYVVSRSESPSDFSGAFTTIVQDGGEFVEDRDWRDRGVIFDGRPLYCYLVSPGDCGTSLLGSMKSATPYPVLLPGIGGVPGIEYAITLVNDGSVDVWASVTDDVPFGAGGMLVLEVPPGATDLSQPAPAGANGNGQVLVTGINVPRGGSALVRFSVTVAPSAAPRYLVIDNQAVLQVIDSPIGVGGTYVTDDSATSAFQDDTRVILAFPDQRMHVHAMWHADVDLDLRVIDTCGNVISAQDLATGTCGTSTANLVRTHSCTTASFPSRVESVQWGFGLAPAGLYRIEMAYPASAAEDVACGARGPEEVTVLMIPASGASQWVTTRVDPGSGFVPVLEFTLP